MLQAIIQTLQIMGWLGIALGILSIVNILTGTLINIWSKNEKFNLKKLLKGISKVLIFYLSAAAVGIVFTMLPFINEMIINAFNMVLISNDLLNTFSSVGILSIVVSTIIVEARKAVSGIIELANLSTGEKIKEGSE